MPGAFPAKVAVVKPLQPLKALSPMVKMLVGMVTLFKVAQFLKASSPITTTGLPSIVPGITSDSVAGQVYPIIVIRPFVLVYIKPSGVVEPVVVVVVSAVVVDPDMAVVVVVMGTVVVEAGVVVGVTVVLVEVLRSKENVVDPGRNSFTVLSAFEKKFPVIESTWVSVARACGLTLKVKAPTAPEAPDGLKPLRNTIF